MVVLGVKMVYVPFMPGHRKRLTQTYVPVDSLLTPPHTPHTHRMVQLLKPDRDRVYVDLTVSMDTGSGEDTPGPPVRYYFQ